MHAEQEKLERLHEQLRYDVGPGICAALGDTTVTEIKVAEGGKLWLRKHVVGWEDTRLIVPVEQRLRVKTLGSCKPA